MSEPQKKPSAVFNVGAFNQQVKFSRMGKKVRVEGYDGTWQESDSVEANLLLEILNTLKKK